MEFATLNETKRIRRLAATTPWVISGAATGSVSPEMVQAGIERGRMARALAFQAAVRGLIRALSRLARRIVPRVPAGALGPEAIDFDCAHGRPC